ncbi:aminopeptidase N-like [Odontomachus brunneus]|uniref:aminopeptidase N-like n=1 Tax=Odontomachus brunneus TaxID=486640 RepID=UPI0013F247DC|nr:aminopeptidase N-like [Odontomachus brunneus]
MRVISLKLLFRVILIFTIKIADTTNADTNLEDDKYCSNISGLLPISVVAPIKYDIQLDIRFGYRLISGMSKITFLVRKRTKVIHLHSHGLNVDYHYTKLTLFIQFSGQKDESEIVLYTLKEHKKCDGAQILILLFDENLYPGKYNLHLKFSYLREQLGVIQYSFLTNNIPRLLITNMYQRNAIRAMFPCWDDPAVRASFNISIKHPNSTEVFSNKPVLKTTTDIYGVQKEIFHEMLSMPTYLIGIVIVDLISELEQMNFNYFWHEEDLFDITSRIKTAKLQLAKTSIANLTSILSDIMQMNFTNVIKKIDHVVLNTKMKSVGKPGLIVYKERDILFNETLDFSGRRLQIMLLIARELVYQVFYSVSNNSYSDTSLNEMLVLFYSYYAVSQMSIKFPVMELFVVQHVQPIMDFDYDFVRNFRNSKDAEKIDSVTYPLYVYKGVALIRMLFYIVTPKTFREGMSEYVKNKTHDLWEAMQNAYHSINKENYTISKIMDTWLRQEHYPEVYVQRNFNGTVVCSLSAFNLDVTWQIPITYITQSDLIIFTLGNVEWLNYYQEVTISDIEPNDFILVNLQQIGYYRVNYNSRNWEKIALYLKFDSYELIPVLNRAQLISDSYYFASKGELESTIFLDIIRYLKRETDYIAWYPMFNIILSMSTYLLKYPESAFVKDHIIEILDGLLKNIGLKDFPTDEEGAVTSLRLIAKGWACTFGHKECIEDASIKLMTRISNSHMKTDEHEIESLWKNMVLCVGIKTLNMTQWRMILDKAMIEYDNNILRLLACSENKDIIIYYLDLLLDLLLYQNKKISWKDIYYDIVKRNANKPAVLKHILDNFIIIKSKRAINDTITLAHIILNMYSTEDLDKIEKYIAKDLSLWTDHCLKCTVNRLILWQKKQMAKVISKFSFF